jgi:hypothetical protein
LLQAQKRYSSKFCNVRLAAVAVFRDVMLNDSDRPEADLPLEMHMGLESLLISLLVEAPVSMALAILSVDLIGVESAPKWWSSFLPCHL